MKYYSNNFDHIIDQIKQKNISSILLYGPNNGMILELIKKLASSFNAHISSTTDIENLVLAVKNTNMFEQKELIKINADFKLDNIVKEILCNFSDKIIVVTGEELSPSNSIRKFFESEKTLASIACYLEDAESITRIISHKVTAANKKIEKTALNFLIHTISHDRLIILTEIEKLLIYTAKKEFITLQDVKDTLFTASTPMPDLLAIAFATKDSARYLKELDKILAESVSEIWVIRALARYFINLLKVKLFIIDSISLETAIQAIKPPI
ncbi:MAG: hypothetical protein SFT68_04600, partial [Rickettsiaceae bacterium]|nr:hypothetical protein [Rickettsiaceae bacterium]